MYRQDEQPRLMPVGSWKLHTRRHFQASTVIAPELIEISVTLSGPSTASLAQNPGSSPEPGTVALGTTQVQIYDSGSPGYGGEIGRAAETTLGTYPMFFGMHYLAYGAWNPTIAQRDVALFLAMMQGYRRPA